MTYYLISFPSAAMDVPEAEMPAVGAAAHAVIREAQDAGVYVFAGGINEDFGPLLVDGDGAVIGRTYPQTEDFDGGFTVLDLPSPEAAVEWAGKIAAACRCAQEVRAFQVDPEM